MTTTAIETQPQIVTFITVGTYRGNLRTDVTARQFEIGVAEPEDLGGDDSAPNPMELLLAGLDGCLAVVADVVAAEYEAKITSLSLVTNADLDARGFLGTAEVQPYFQAVRTEVDIEIDLPREKFAEYTETVLRRCPAATLILAANVDFEIAWTQL